MEDPNSQFLTYLIAAIIGLAITFLLCRWIFGIDKRIKQNKSIINLLALLAKKQGATNDEIHICINHEL
jgi:uncharacterized membrane protein YdjX (TVP38/TMEM64 family)